MWYFFRPASILQFNKITIILKTRMHSSRMRTARSGGRPGGDLHQAHPSPHPTPRSRYPPSRSRPPPQSRPPAAPSCQEQTPPTTPPDQTPPGADTLPPPRQHTPPCYLLTESQTPVKILPCPNFVAGGNNA